MVEMEDQACRGIGRRLCTPLRWTFLSLFLGYRPWEMGIPKGNVAFSGIGFGRHSGDFVGIRMSDGRPVSA